MTKKFNPLFKNVAHDHSMNLKNQFKFQSIVFFSIPLNCPQMSELINIKQLIKGRTPTLSRCAKHFNDITSWVKTLARMADELGRPTKGLSSHTDRRSPPIDATSTGHHLTCVLCGCERKSPASAGRLDVTGSPLRLGSPAANGTGGTGEDRSSVTATSGTKTKSKGIAGYFCMPTGSPHLSLRSKRYNELLEGVLWKLVQVAEVSIIICSANAKA